MIPENWKLKILKLSTYNSLNNQLKLKDTIIGQYSESLAVEKTMNKVFQQTIERKEDMNIINEKIIKALEEKIVSYEKLQELMQTTLANRTGEKIALQQELEKYKGKRDAKGLFISKSDKLISDKYTRKAKAYCNWFKLEYPEHKVPTNDFYRTFLKGIENGYDTKMECDLFITCVNQLL